MAAKSVWSDSFGWTFEDPTDGEHGGAHGGEHDGESNEEHDGDSVKSLYQRRIQILNFSRKICLSEPDNVLPFQFLSLF